MPKKGEVRLKRGSNVLENKNNACELRGVVRVGGAGGRHLVGGARNEWVERVPR